MTDGKQARSGAEWIKGATQQGREAFGAKAADRLGGLTPEQIAQIERIAAKMPPGVLQQTLAGAFSKLDPATLGQMAEKLSASGANPPAEKRTTDPTTLAVLAATAMRGRAGGVAGLLMILAGSAIANRDKARPAASGAQSALLSAGRSVAGALGTIADKAAEAGSKSSSPRIRSGVASLQGFTALARSPLARNVMNQLGPAILERGKKGR
jgi:hypothetical protein